VTKALLAFALAAGLALAAGPEHAATASIPHGALDTTATTVFLVRHAEKLPHPAGGDSGLSAAGLARAEELTRVLRDERVAAIYVSQYGRTRLTGVPLARELRDSVRTYDANRNDLLAERVRREHRGKTVLVVGHSDSLPEFYEAFTGVKLPEGARIAYDRLFVLTLRSDGSHTLARLRYGAVPAP